MAGKEGYVWKLGEILVQQGWIRWAQLEEALELQRKTGYMMGDIVVKRGYVGQKEGSILYLGEILVRNGWISWESLESALQIQRENGKKLGDILLENNFVFKQNLYNALALQHNIPFVNLEEFMAQPEAIQLIPRAIAHEQKILPLIHKDHILVMAVSDPSQIVPQDELRLPLDPECKIHFVLSCPEDLHAAIHRYYPESAAA
jgi:type IV pilus assembly protein PilB